jgi:sulfite exporter TauE/SafE
VAKLIAYTVLGFLLGLFGSVFQLSIGARVLLQIIVVIIMFGVALNLLEVHPIFRYFAIQPPKFLLRKVKNTTKSKSVFAPFILGLFTIFIPCGVTQAMMALAIGSSNPLLGATIMFTFILGTSPLFFLIGYFTVKLGDVMKKSFLKVVAIVLIILAVYNLNQALVASGSSFSFQSLTAGNSSETKVEKLAPVVNNEATITITDAGYNPSSITVKAGSHVKLTLVNDNARGCIQMFVIPKLNIQQVVRTNTKEVVEFDASTSPEQLTYTCSMGMYRGTINVE